MVIELLRRFLRFLDKKSLIDFEIQTHFSSAKIHSSRGWESSGWLLVNINADTVLEHSKIEKKKESKGNRWVYVANEGQPSRFLQVKIKKQIKCQFYFHNILYRTTFS